MKAKKSKRSKLLRVRPNNKWTSKDGVTFESAEELAEHLAELARMRANAAARKDDSVNHPQHYGGADNPYETIKVQEANLTPDELIGALKFQVHKYLDRHRRKGGLEDIRKALWYLNRLVSYIESRDLGRSVGP